MKLRERRKMRTKPRAHTFQFSMQCAPYTIEVEGSPWEMTTRRVYAGFTMQHATTRDYVRKLQEFAAREKQIEVICAGEQRSQL